jgi:hypothetical protein
VSAEVHRNHAYRVRFNAEPHYPQILDCIEEVPVPKRTRQRKGQP